MCRSEKIELRVAAFFDGERVEERSTPSGDEERGQAKDIARREGASVCVINGDSVGNLTRRLALE